MNRTSMPNFIAPTRLDDFTTCPGTGKREPVHVLLHGDVFDCLVTLQDGSVGCAITSPPYWAQRDYGFDGQIGNEATIDGYIGTVASVFRALKSKIEDAGVLFLNVGDKYIGKYGNSPLGMIPYRLAWCMVTDGWMLEDIVAWYKPNHMPSSVQNRFTNTYEPVLVLAKTPGNHYRKYRKMATGCTNVIEIPLQQLQYPHVAPFPEKLVEALVSMGIPGDATVLDPFAGSGTVMKAMQYMNSRHERASPTISIEASDDAVQIIRQRCSVPSMEVVKVPGTGKRPLPVQVPPPPPFPGSSDGVDVSGTVPRQVIVEIFPSIDDFRSFVPSLSNGIASAMLEDDGVLFTSIPGHDIGGTVAISSASGWVVRNVLAIPGTRDWLPVAMLVKDIKSVRYRCNIDAMRVDHDGTTVMDWKAIDFIGMDVRRNGAFTRFPDTGKVARVINKKEGGMPWWIAVDWHDGTTTVEEVINHPVPGRQATFACPSCAAVLFMYHHPIKEISCPACKTMLWKDVASIPVLAINARDPPSIPSPPPAPRGFTVLVPEMHEERREKEYGGKFKDATRVNMGQSPGARSSTTDQFLSMKRYHDVRQSMFSDYLNLHRERAGLSKKALTSLFPPSYRHTCGHWLRKDMAGSIPKIEDLAVLRALLHLDDSYVAYASMTGYKIQAVLASEGGKNPGDYLFVPIDDLPALLERVGDP